MGKSKMQEPERVARALSEHLQTELNNDCPEGMSRWFDDFHLEIIDSKFEDGVLKFICKDSKETYELCLLPTVWKKIKG